MIDELNLAAITAPTLVVGDDDMIEREHGEFVARSIPGARMEILHGAHFVAAEPPGGFDRTVVAFP